MTAASSSLSLDESVGKRDRAGVYLLATVIAIMRGVDEDGRLGQLARMYI